MCTSRLQEVWFEVLFVRSNLVGTVKGGVSSILRALLNTFFNPNTHDLRRSGVCLRLKTDIVGHHRCRRGSLALYVRLQGGRRVEVLPPLSEHFQLQKREGHC